MTSDDLAAILCIVSLLLITVLGGAPGTEGRLTPCAHRGRVHYVRDIRTIE